MEEINNTQELDNTIVLTGEDGTETTFEFLDLIEYAGKEYVVLLPQNDEDDEVVILQVEENANGDEEYSAITDDTILNEVFKIFKNNYKDEFNFTDEPQQSGKKSKCRSRLALVLISGILGWWGTHLKWLGYKEEAKEWKSEAGGIFGLFDLGSWGMVFGNYIAVIFGKYRVDAYGNPVRYFAFIRNLFRKK